METETKQLYTDLMEARGRAAQRYRVHFVRLAGNGYATYEDTDPAPDGNGILDIAADTGVARANVRHAIIADPAGLAAFEFDRNGIASALGNIRFVSTAAPDYDCITILPTRVKMGQYSGGTCVEK